MHVEVRQATDSDGVIIVDFQGRLMAGVGSEIFREVLDELVAEGYGKILINLSNVSRIDSAGIGELVGSVRMAERLGSRVRLQLPGGRVRDVLELSQILPAFNFHEAEDEALEGFRREAAEAAADG